jgi:hypothetical protein
MTRRLPLLAAIGLALLVLVVLIIVLSRPSSALFSREPVQREVAIYATVTAVANPETSAPLEERPLSLPVLLPGDPCPLSKGSAEIVPREPYIFCAGCLWFGRGPAYFPLTFHDRQSEDAVFSLDEVPHSDSSYRVKTPWVSKPKYEGPILIRGRQLDGTGEHKLGFSTDPSGGHEQLQLTGYGGPDSTLWGFWIANMWVPGPGCYGVQIDTMPGTDIVIFKATRSEPAPDGTPIT